MLSGEFMKYGGNALEQNSQIRFSGPAIGLGALEIDVRKISGYSGPITYNHTTEISWVHFQTTPIKQIA